MGAGPWNRKMLGGDRWDEECEETCAIRNGGKSSEDSQDGRDGDEKNEACGTGDVEYVQIREMPIDRHRNDSQDKSLKSGRRGGGPPYQQPKTANQWYFFWHQ
jgi:hypothetical protein